MLHNGLPSIAETIPDHDIAKAVTRQRLATWDSEYPVAPLRDGTLIARAVGLSVAEVQRVSGAARQTLYRILRDTSQRQPPDAQVGVEILTLLAAEGKPVTPELLATRAQLDVAQVHRVAMALVRGGECRVDSGAYGEMQANPETYAVLRENFADLYLRRSDAFSVYVRVPEDQAAAIATAAEQVVAAEETVAIARSVAPSSMAGPEQAFMVQAPTARRAIETTRVLWQEVLRKANLPDSVAPAITNVLAPAGRPHDVVSSDVLDAFVERISAAGVQGRAIYRIRSGFLGDVSEKDLAARCVMAAAVALRRALGNENHPRPIRNGEDAFAEYQPARSVPTTPEVTPVKNAAVAALDVAVDRLGPFPAGRLGAIKAPGAEPSIVETVEPTPADLITMARHAGDAVGAAVQLGALDPGVVVRDIVLGSGGRS